MNPRPSRFLTTPLWQTVKRTYRTVFFEYGTKLRRSPLAKQGLKAAIILVAIYIALIGSNAVAIYKFKTTSAISRFGEKLFPYPAAVVGGQSIPLSRFRMEVAARQHFAQVNSVQASQQDTEKFVMDQLITKKLVELSLKKNGIAVADSEVKDKLDEMYNQIGDKDKLQLFLEQNYGSGVTIDTFERWVRETTLDEVMKRQLLERVSVRHILVAAPEGSTDEQVASAKQRALEIKASITDTSQFAEVAQTRSEDVASRDKGGQLGETNRSSDTPIISADFEAAIFNLPTGTVSEPIRSPFGWHLVLIDEKSGKIPLSRKAYLEQLHTEYGVKILLTQ